MERKLQWAATCAVLAMAGGHTEIARAQVGGTLIDELVVTAQKREERLQDVPVAVSAYTSEMRDLIGIKTVQDLATFTPGLSFNPGLDRMSLRGIGRLTNVLGSDPGVAVYNDGFYTASNAEASKTPLFVERTEVLRGPQGTLYGRNSIGGAINVISRRPEREFSGEVRGALADYDQRQVEGVVSLPINEALRAKLGAIYTRQDEGYYTNRAGGPSEGGVVDDSFFEAQLAADLGENVSVWLKYSTASWDRRGRTTSLTTPYYNTASPIFTDGSPAGPNAFLRPEQLFPSPLFLYGTPNPATSDPWSFSTDTPASMTLDDNHQLVAEVVWDFGGASLKYVGGYNQYLYRQVTDYDRTARSAYAFGPFTIYPQIVSEYVEDKKYWSNEINLTSVSDGPLQWILGLYHYREKYRQPITLYAPNQPQLGAPRIGVAATPGAFFLPAAPNPQRLVYHSFGDLDTTAVAAFGQVDYSLSPKFRLTAGLRYSRDEKQALERTRLVLWNPVTLGDMSIDVTGASGGTGPASRRLKGAWEAWSGVVGVDWTPDDDTLVYAKYSRGYKAGGFNLGALAQRPAVDPEFVDAYELGLKKTFGRSLQVNAAAFHYAYEGAQVPVSVVRNGVNQSEFVNIEESRSQGVELEAIWAPTDSLRFLVNYSYLDARIEKACCVVNAADLLARDVNASPAGPLVAGRQGQDLSGNALPSTPKHKLAVNGSYRFDFTAGSLTASATYAWRDAVNYGIFDFSQARAPAEDQIDARLIWRDAGDRYSLIVFGRNLTDEELVNGLEVEAENAGSPRLVTLAPPRTFGVELQYRF
jgi:iron complex outermembrane recepter protein